MGLFKNIYKSEIKNMSEALYNMSNYTLDALRNNK